MDFSDAVLAMRNGAIMRRPSFGSLRSRYSVKLNNDQTDFVRVSAGADTIWQASTADILAADWSIA